MDETNPSTEEYEKRISELREALTLVLDAAYKNLGGVKEAMRAFELVTQHKEDLGWWIAARMMGEQYATDMIKRLSEDGPAAKYRKELAANGKDST